MSFPAAKKITFGKEKGDFNLQNVKFNLQMSGDFNYYNALAAICVARNYGIGPETCRKAVESLKGIPGRMEQVASDPFEVFVDFAFTPDALEKVYKTFKEKSLICVLGACGGGRDKWKRPVLGEIADKYCKEIIVTNEDPYDEDPIEIITQVAEPVKRAQKILDRKEAIEAAIKLAKPKDVVIITGKGSEPLMCLANGQKIPWDDRKIAKDALNKINY